MENKIDKRKNYVLMLDTETANGLEDSLFYDCGGEVISTWGEHQEDFSFVNKDIFLGEKDLMTSAYYADKLPQYWEEIKSGQRKMATTYEIKQKIAELIKKYNIKAIIAHNARFDVRACNNTQRYVTKSKYRYFFPRGIEVWDTMKMARSVICKMPTYQKFCHENGYLTKNGQLRVTAEILYRFISKDNEFAEAHTGLEDVKIEKEIYLYCRRQHKAMEKRIY